MNIEEAITAIRSKWAIPVSSIPDLREILAKLTPRCGQAAWPYTENNICVLDQGHAGKHKDPKGREFDAGGYKSNQT